MKFQFIDLLTHLISLLSNKIPYRNKRNFKYFVNRSEEVGGLSKNVDTADEGWESLLKF